MKKIKIVYDRDKCIGAATCAAVDPKRWKMNKDGKADLLKGEKNDNEKYTLELEVDDEELKNIKDAATSCPVQVIKIQE